MEIILNNISSYKEGFIYVSVWLNIDTNEFSTPSYVWRKTPTGEDKVKSTSIKDIDNYINKIQSIIDKY